MGLWPDGVEPAQVNQGDNPSRLADRGAGEAIEHSWTRADAMRSPSFWRLAVFFGLFMFVITSMGLFRIPFFSERGIPPPMVALALSAEAIAAILAALPTGWALDRFQGRYISLGSFVAMVGAIMVTINVETTWHVFLATILFGAGAAVIGVLRNTVWPQYFGSAHVGSIRGASMPITLVLGALGGPVAGMVKDATGSFVPVWWICMGAVVLATILILCTPKPRVPV